jgi:hypothetical protein
MRVSDCVLEVVLDVCPERYAFCVPVRGLTEGAISNV